MKNAAIAVAAAAFAALAALPAAADQPPMPRMLKGMDKGQWRMEFLEHSQAKPGQQIPAMTMCTDNLMKDIQKDKPAAKSDPQCKHRLLKDSSDEAVWEIACPKRTVTTTMKRESSKSILADVKTTGDKPASMKIRYTNLGPCRPSQATMTLDKNSEQCRKIQEMVAKMDPAKSCAQGKADERARCEKMIRDQIAQAKATCN